MKKIFTLFAAILLSVTMIFSSFSGKKNSERKNADVVDNTIIQVFSNNVNEASGHAVPQNGLITIVFQGQSNMNGTATITYTTVDRSAIASTGDYSTSEGTITLSASHPVDYVYISVAQTTFASNYNGQNITRFFAFDIIDVNYDYGDVSTREIICDMDFAHKIETKVSSVNGKTFYYYAGYEYSTDFNNHSESQTVDAFDTDKFGPWFGTNAYSFWIEDYINTGLANAYVGIRTHNVTNSWACSCGDVAYTLYRYNSMDYRLTQLYYDYNRLYHTSTPYSEQYGSHINDDMTIRNYGNTEKVFYQNDWIYRGVKLTDQTKTTNSLNDLKVYMEIDNDISATVYSVKGTEYLDEVLYDDIAPTFETAYFDGDHAYIDGYARIYLRYSEPVQVYNDQGAYARVAFGSYNVNFEYESGNFTDTLVFRCKLADIGKIASTDITYTAGTLVGVFETSAATTECANIGDMAYLYCSDGVSRDCNRASGKITNSKAAIKNFHLDLSTPEAKKTKEDYSGAQASRTVQVNVSNCTNGTMYYVWSTQSTLDIEYSKGMGNYSGFLKQFTGKAFIHNSDGTQKVNVESYDEDGNKLHGNYYLHVFIESQNGKGYYIRFGSTSEKPYILDSKAPEFAETITSDASNTPKSRSYSVGLTDSGEGVSKIELVYKKTYGEEARYTIWQTGDSTDIYDGTTLNFTITPEILGLGENEYGYFDFSLYAVDTCENETLKQECLKAEFFDTRNLFEVSVTKESGNDCFYSTTLSEEAYLLGNDLKFSYLCTDPDGTKLEIEKLIYNGVTLIENHQQMVTDEELSNYLDFGVDASQMEYIIMPKKSGKMVLSFNLDRSKYTKDICYYFTSEYQDETYNGEQILSRDYVKTYVYALSTNPYTYLLQESTSGIQTSNYGDTTSPLLFSDYDTAKSYVEYMEKQDMYLVTFDDSSGNILNWLNHGGSSDYFKADGEKMTAKAGQTWIRYKTNGWTYDNQKWAYYYYGDSGDNYKTINFSLISENLSNAISNVATTITDLGAYTYLTTEDYENAYGQLRVNTKQIQASTLTCGTTKSGSSFTNNITYFGDSEIYCSEYYSYTYQDGSVVFNTAAEGIRYVMQYKITASEDTRLYYYEIGVSEKFSYSKIPSYSSKWIEMENANGQYFDSFFADNISGVFVIMELDNEGVHVFRVYIDHLAPELAIEYVASSDSSEVVSDTLTHFSDNKTIGVNKITFKTFNTSEADPYSYVSIYKANYSRTYLGTYILSDLLKKEIALDDGAYYIVVGDRFGNSYTVKLNYNTTELVVSVTISDDETYFSVDCNREEDQIFEYQIIRGNEVITTEYSQHKKIYNSGNYIIKIKDIYGNEYINTGDDGTGFHFQKALPEVTWRYETNDGYVTYKEGGTDQPMLISESEDDYIFFISTAVNLQFVLTGNIYQYEFISGNPEINPSTGTNTTRVSINSTSGWKLKIWYEAYPDVYSLYICDVDNKAPSIVAYYDTYEYTVADEEYLNSIAMSYDEENVVIQGNSYQFVKDETIDPLRNYIRSGDVIQTNSFSFNISDDNIIKSVVVTIDGVVSDAKLTTSSNGTISGEFSQYGVYKIVATDIFGNATSIQFENREIVKVEHYVDDTEVSLTKTYGNTSDVLKMSSVGSVYYLIDNKQYLFNVNTSGLYLYQYVTQMIDGSMGWAIIKEQDLFLLNNADYEDNKWYQLSSTDELIYVCHTDEGFFIKVEAKEETRVSISYSVLLDNGSEPFEFSSVLSKELTDIGLYYPDGNKIVTNHDNGMVLIYDEFVFDTDNIDYDILNRVRISFSKTTEFTYYTTLYTDGQNFMDYITSRNGFYSIEITNVFGNVLNYYLNKSDSMTVITTAVYSDGTTNTYSNDYSSIIYSNNAVTIAIYSTKGTFEIVRAGQTYYVEPETSGDSMSITICESGKYTVTIKDEFGNTQIRSIDIEKSTLQFSDDLIYGYNENALLLEQGYTNQKLSINFDKVQEMNICSVSIVSSEGTQIVYDQISEKKVSATNDSLKDVIGNSGTGDYNIVFRDIHGNKTVKTIHYNEDGTLSVLLNYRSSLDYINADIEDEIWSNNSIQINSTSSKYLIYIDNNRVECPINLSFSSYDGSGQKDYHIVYKDEYGFEYDFYVHLLRQEIVISKDDGIETMDIDGVTTTKDDILVNFPEDTVCTYALNGTGTYTYSKGQVIVQDGVYTFSAKDKAGNVGTYIIAKDTSVEYRFQITSADFVLMNGGVSNYSVDFKALNSDSAYIYLVLKDGEVYSEGTSITKFTETGKYQVLVRDTIGNESYFTFYIITHKLASLEYQVPYNYTISDAWITPSAGYIMSYMDSVDSETGFKAETDGYYTITLLSSITGSVYSFNFTIDSTPSSVELVGVEDGGTTTSDVSFKNAAAGDTFYIYKDGKLYKKVTLTSVNDAPTISEGGIYKVVVVNEAGVEVTFSFTRAKILNTAGSSLVMVVAGIAVLALFVGLLFRRRSKIDK